MDNHLYPEEFGSCKSDNKCRSVTNLVVNYTLLLLALSLIALGLGGSLTSFSDVLATGKSQPIAPTTLIYLAQNQKEPQAPVLMQRPHENLTIAPEEKMNESALSSLGIPARCEISGLHPAPTGYWIVAQVNCEDGGFVQIMQASSGQVRDLDASLGRDTIFLSWTPRGDDLIVKVDAVRDPRVYRVDIDSGKAKALPVPWSTYNVTFSHDGKRMLCALSQGLGFGSEVWIADAEGNNPRRILNDPAHIIAFPRWSPSDDRIAYIRMPDSNVPFTIGELWVMDGEGNDPTLLGEADAGHGYAPAWSPDGTHIAFVGRENETNKTADQLAERLTSNIYLVDVRGQRVTAATRFKGALTEAPVWSPDGKALTFSSTAGGTMDVWIYEPEAQQLQQVTHGANAHHPTWLPGK
jgi:dipeptidyl aminopeptidase/acylaminoacyl peptidase